VNPDPVYSTSTGPAPVLMEAPVSAPAEVLERPVLLPAQSDTPPKPVSACARGVSCLHGEPEELAQGVKLRMGLMVLPIFLLLGYLSWRLVKIEVYQAPAWQEAAVKQSHSLRRNDAPRGEIRARTGTVIATSVPTKTVIADLKILADDTSAAEALAPILGFTPEALAAKLQVEDRRVVYLARDVDPETAKKIAALKIRGIGFEDTYKRFYPWAESACHLVGWSSLDGGKEGLELSLNDLLRGEAGYTVLEHDGARRPMASGTDANAPSVVEPRPGLTIVLTIDPAIQHVAEEELAKIMEQFEPTSATALVMDVETGAILAAAVVPNFNPNAPGHSPTENYRNRTLTDCYEPGSTFKTFIAALALERHLFNRTDKFNCENGSWNLGYRVLHDSHSYGILSFDEVLMHSSNIGAAKIGLRLGMDGVYQATQLFGFGQKTGIDEPGERSGTVRPRKFWTRDSLLSVPMGQEVSVTPMQLVAGYVAMVNGGHYLRPKLVQRIQDANGNTVYEMRPQVLRQVISEATSKAMREILVGVVENGTGKAAKCKNGEYVIGGKTGTAQKVENGHYSHDKYVGSFCGFAPADKPKLVCLITVDEPHKGMGYYGGTVAAPGVREVLCRGLQVLGIPPKTQPAPAAPHATVASQP